MSAVNADPDADLSVSPPGAQCWGELRSVIEVISRKSGSSLPVPAAPVVSSVALLAQFHYRSRTLGTDAQFGVYFWAMVSSGGRKTASFGFSRHARG